jgi:hypothetical protein
MIQSSNKDYPMPKDIPLSKEAYLHAMEDTKNIKPERSRQTAVTGHAQSDMAIDPAMSHDVQKPAGRKIGAEHAMGMLRLGGHELTAALQALPDSNIRPMDEPGVFGNENAPHIVDEPSYEESLRQYASRSTPDRDNSRTR